MNKEKVKRTRSKVVITNPKSLEIAHCLNELDEIYKVVQGFNGKVEKYAYLVLESKILYYYSDLSMRLEELEKAEEENQNKSVRKLQNSTYTYPVPRKNRRY